ncbi:hypothetical protein XELAEV_18001777mg [Xenopus laevis]|nr:hypothetical protein XELAEV_18001777mg [Xenopus laevis]
MWVPCNTPLVTHQAGGGALRSGRRGRGLYLILAFWKCEQSRAHINAQCLGRNITKEQIPMRGVLVFEEHFLKTEDFSPSLSLPLKGWFKFKVYIIFGPWSTFL